MVWHTTPNCCARCPFTPSVGPRLALTPGLNEAELRTALAEAMHGRGLAPGRVILPPAVADTPVGGLGRPDMLSRLGFQYHWRNEGYQSFDAFLQALNARKRKNLRKERQGVAGQGIQFRHFAGEGHTDDHPAQGLFRVLSGHLLQAGTAPLPQPGFLPPATGPAARADAPGHGRERGPLGRRRPVPQRPGHTPYGRYWGCLEDYNHLHFETCYYQGIDLCIAEGLQRFDAGAQGEHKLSRGFRPVLTRSLHWIAHPAFRAAVRDFVEAEADDVRAYVDEATAGLPFRQP